MRTASCCVKSLGGIAGSRVNSIMRTFGVEEELLLVDPRSGVPVAAAPRILNPPGRPRAPELLGLEGEMQQEMLEVVGEPCGTLDELAAGIADGRRRAASAARLVGARAVALATSPVPVTPHCSPTERYGEMMRRYGATARRSLACGMHVHVSIESADEGVAVLDRVREWLPLLLALSANSAFCEGADTGYASWRSEMWNRWPCSGPNPVFGSAEAYRAHERDLLATAALLDAGMLYFDARLSRHHPTVELRIADVCLREEDAVTIAGLARALVETAAAEWRAGVPPLGTDQRLLRLAGWRAALSGVRGVLVHPVTGGPCSPKAALAALVEHTAAALSASGDAERVRTGVAAILERGTGADWQRARFAERGRAADVVRAAVTAPELLAA